MGTDNDVWVKQTMLFRIQVIDNNVRVLETGKSKDAAITDHIPFSSNKVKFKGKTPNLIK